MDLLCIYVPVFNEAERLENFLDDLPEDIKIYAVNKSSTDASVEILQKYKNVEVINIPYGAPSSEHYHWAEIKDKIIEPWILNLVVSQKVDRSLVKEIYRNIALDTCDIISVPFKNYTLGFEENYNPWPNNITKNLVSKKSHVRYTPMVHRELNHLDGRIKVINSEHGWVRHRSNSTIEKLLQKSISYAEQEVNQRRDAGTEHESLKSPMKFILKSMYNGFMRRRFTIFRGRKGVLLGACYVTTQLLILIFAIAKDIKDDET